MIRRSPTRIELKLEDLKEYETMRREIEAKKGHPPSAPWTVPKTKQDMVRERIGYVPQPQDP